MKKVFALGVASMLMMGSASQAMAAFEAGNLIMSIYDSVNMKEMGIDLGALNLTGSNVLLQDGINLSGWNLTDATSGVGIFTYSGTSTSNYKGYVGLTDKDGSAPFYEGTQASAIFSAFRSDYTAIRADYLVQGGGAEIVTVPIVVSGTQYYSQFNSNGDSNGYYNASLENASYEAEVPETGYVDIYLYDFQRVAVTYLDENGVQRNGYDLQQISPSYAATIRLEADGQVWLNPTAAPAVPVPGASLLLGSALLGLAGLRRRQNA